MVLWSGQECLAYIAEGFQPLLAELIRNLYLCFFYCHKRRKGFADVTGGPKAAPLFPVGAGQEQRLQLPVGGTGTSQEPSPLSCSASQEAFSRPLRLVQGQSKYCHGVGNTITTLPCGCLSTASC